MNISAYHFNLLAIGCSLSVTSFSLALNTYFNKRRNLATGLSSAITGLGPVIMPIVRLNFLFV